VLIEIGIAIEIAIGSIRAAFDNDPDPDSDPDFDLDLEGSIVLHCNTRRICTEVGPSRISRKIPNFLAILAKNRTEPEDAVSRLLHFQALGRLKMARRPAPHGKRQ